MVTYSMSAAACKGNTEQCHCTDCLSVPADLWLSDLQVKNCEC